MVRGGVGESESGGGGGPAAAPSRRDSRHARAPRSTMGEGNAAAARAAERRYGAVCSGLGIGHENKHGRPLNEPVCLPKVKTAVVSRHNGAGLGTAGNGGERPHSNTSTAPDPPLYVCVYKFLT